jgi:hypothetical protein
MVLRCAHTCVFGAFVCHVVLHLRGDSDGGDHDQIDEPNAGALLIDVVDSAGQACGKYPESTLVDLRERILRTYRVRS